MEQPMRKKKSVPHNVSTLAAKRSARAKQGLAARKSRRPGQAKSHRSSLARRKITAAVGSSKKHVERRASKTGNDCFSGLDARPAASLREWELTDFFETVPVALHWLGPDGTILWANQAELDLLGYRREEYVGHHMADFHVDTAVIKDLLSRLMGNGMLHDCEARLRSKDGSIKHVRIDSTARWENGRFVHARCFTHDVTERMQAEEALRASESRFRALIENSSDGITLFSAEGKILYVSASTKRILGYEPADVFGCRAFEFIHPDDEAKVRERLGESLRKPATPVGVQARVRHKDGRWRLVEGSLCNLLAESGVNAIVNNYRDITENRRVEEELATALRDRKNIMESVPDVIYMLDLERKLVRWNRKLEIVSGYAAGELLGKPAAEFFPKEEHALVMKALDEAYLKGAAETELIMLCKDGQRIPCQITGATVKDESGRVIGLAGMGRDIVERKRVEEELAKALRERENIMETIPELIYRLDLDGKMSGWNRKLETVTGYSAGELQGKPASEFFPEEDRPRVKEAIREAYVHGFSQIETCLQHKNGTRIPYHFTGAPLKDEMGRAIGLTGVGRDITERCEAEEKVREQAALLDMAQDAICVTDMDQRVIYWNKSSERLYGWKAAEALGRNANELLFKSDSTRPSEALKSLIRSREWKGELHQVNKSGRDIIVASRWTLVRDQQGAPKSILIINSDITEKKKLETQFLRAQRLDSIGTLASGIAHDLNNILAPILMSVAMLGETATDAEGRKLLASIEMSTRRGADIVKQLLTFARGIEGERVMLQPRHLVKELVKMIRATFPKTITLDTQISSDLWTIISDATQLHQVLLNLCVNARDALPEGGNLSVTAINVMLDEQYASMNPEAKPGPYIELKVADTGVGIPPTIIDQIFDPFFTTKEVGKGTGLGLSTVLGIVKSHSGFVTVQSEVGRGSTFKVFLPAKPNAVTRTDAIEPTALPRGQGELILVVDDEAPIRNVTQKTLERHGYRVETAADGNEAMILYAKRLGQSQLVLTDISMPMMGGVALTRALKRLDPQVKIIVSTGQGQDEKVAELNGLGVTHFLDKPYNTEKLLVMLRKVLAG